MTLDERSPICCLRASKGILQRALGTGVTQQLRTVLYCGGKSKISSPTTRIDMPTVMSITVRNRDSTKLVTGVRDCSRSAVTKLN